MGRYRKHLFENFQDENFNPDTRYELAYKRVKRIKGFYVMHWFMYCKWIYNYFELLIGGIGKRSFF